MDDYRNRILQRKFNILFLTLITLLSLPQVASSIEWRVDGVDRVVAIADIHGAYDAMVSTLQNADILSEELSWVGGQATLVIVGDILDRGPKSRAAMDLLMRLEGEAESADGRVQVLIGNHEAMVLTGDMRYVSGPEYAAFAEDEDPEERARWFELYVERQGANADELRDEFDRNFPPGYFGMRRAFRPDGHYGQWLLQKGIIAVINGTAFVHGGLSPEITEIGLDGVNRALRKNIAELAGVIDVLTDAEILMPTDSHYKFKSILGNYMPDLNEDPAVLQAVDTGIRLSAAPLLGVDGPLWYRSNVSCPGIIAEQRLEEALAAIGADRLVVGHTPTPNRKVLQRFGGRLIEIDTGMLNFYYSGMGHALILEGESATVMSQTGAGSPIPMDHPRQVGRRSPSLTTDRLEQLLETGEIVSVDKERANTDNLVGRTIVKISDGKYTVNAVFHKRQGKGFYPEVAAYRLDRLLDLDMVPVSVIRKVRRSDGSVQFLPDNITDEAGRSASGKGGSASCPVNEQWNAMYVFDALIYNEGRTQRRMLYDKSTWRLMLGEHNRAFESAKGRPSHLRNVRLKVSAGWKNALAEISDEMLLENFVDVLSKWRLRGLASRRDELLETEEKRPARRLR
jgi:hypothetical protein